MSRARVARFTTIAYEWQEWSVEFKFVTKAMLICNSCLYTDEKGLMI